MRENLRDGDLKITIEGPASYFERLERKGKSRKTAKKHTTRRVRVVHK